jgi:5,10-methylenetetrahydromethanopterin reductase
MKVGMYISRAEAPVLVEAAEALERHGVDSLWHDESLWRRGTTSMMAAVAVKTERIRLGIASLNPYIVNPTFIAMQYSVLAEISAGRTVVGIGAGVDSWTEQMGLKWRKPRSSVNDTIHIVRSMLAGEKTTYEGKSFQVKDVEPAFTLNHKAPLFWGAMGDRSIENAGQIADGWVISVMEPPLYVERGMELLRAGAESAGRDARDLEVVQYQLFACDEDRSTARSEIRRLMAELFELEFEFCAGQDALMTALSTHLEGVSADDYRRMMEHLADGVSPDEAIPDEVVDQTAISGTPEDCAAQLRRFEELGVTEVGLLSRPGVDLKRLAKIVGEELKPLVAGPTEVTK